MSARFQSMLHPHCQTSPPAGVSKGSCIYTVDALLVRDLERATAAAIAGQVEEGASSPLAKLLSALAAAWQTLVRDGTPEQFAAWLEQTSVTEQGGEVESSVEYLDSLDAFLLAAVQELEELRGEEIPAADFEGEL